MFFRLKVAMGAVAMKRGSICLMAALALNFAVSAPDLWAKVPAAAPASPPDRALPEGQIISSAPDLVIGGWRRLYQSDYAKRTPSAEATAETRQCCFSVFGKGKALLVVTSEPVSRDAKGMPQTERIQHKLWVTQRAGEVMADCTIFWLETALSLVDEKTDAVRSVVIDGGIPAMLNWRGSGDHCAFGD
jgi:hypothetical protein